MDLPSEIEQLQTGDTITARFARGGGDWSKWTQVPVYIQRNTVNTIVTIAIQGMAWAEYPPEYTFEGKNGDVASFLVEDYRMEVRLDASKKS